MNKRNPDWQKVVDILLENQSQKQLGEKVGISQQHLSSIKTGKRGNRISYTLGYDLMAEYEKIMSFPRKTYLVRNTDSNLYRIGVSINPERRLSEMKSASGDIFELLFIIDDDVDADLKQKFATQHHFADWFTDDGGSMQAYFEKHGQPYNQQA